MQSLTWTKFSPMRGGGEIGENFLPAEFLAIIIIIYIART